MKRSFLLAACGVCLTAGMAFGQDTFWGIDNGADTLGTFTSDNPGVFNGIGTTGITDGFVNSIEFDGSGNLYASSGVTLYSLDQSTGAATRIGSHGSGDTITDFTWDGSTMWAIGTLCGAQSSLWNVDLGTGAATLVCTTDIAGACDVGLTVGYDGNVYGHDLVTDQIYSVDVSTCATSTVVSLPFDTNFGQGLTASGTANYHVAFNATAFQGELHEFESDGTYNFLGALGPLQIAGADVEGGAGDCLDLLTNDFVAGQNAVWKVEGATPGEQVAIVWGTSPGQTLLNGFAGYCSDFGIQGVSQKRLICRKSADGAGSVSCQKRIPAGAGGLRILSQASERNTCPDTCMSNLDDQVIQ